MNTDHWFLLAYWILFSGIHHVMATENFKSFSRRTMGNKYKYYSLIYSLIAFFTLGLVLNRQLTITSPLANINPWLRFLLGFPMGVAGLTLMFLSMQKYFLNLSGIGIFFPDKPLSSLEIRGVHRLVRHPLYLGTLLFTWSLLFLFPYLSNLLACVAITIYTIVGIRSEERKLFAVYGAEYSGYCKNTPRLIPDFPTFKKIKDPTQYANSS